MMQLVDPRGDAVKETCAVCRYGFRMSGYDYYGASDDTYEIECKRLPHFAYHENTEWCAMFLPLDGYRYEVDGNETLNKILPQ